jgi:hypothetical protein
MTDATRNGVESLARSLAPPEQALLQTLHDKGAMAQHRLFFGVLGDLVDLGLVHVTRVRTTEDMPGTSRLVEWGLTTIGQQVVEVYARQK